ncbi:partial Type-4 uracil-DNA glycosylase, partial [uncultured bacterium]
MNNATRLQYLKTMGIDVWIPRFAPPVLSDLPETKIEEVMPESMVDIEQQWKDLRTEVSQCTLCGLCQTRTQTVFGTGNPNADWLIIGEAPGQQEDEQGEPFVGIAGQLLTEMLRAIGLSRDEVFIANILKCRPPNNRDPHVDEIQHCQAYLHRQLALIQPKIILAVGRIAAHTLLNTNTSLGKLRGQVHDYQGIP